MLSEMQDFPLTKSHIVSAHEHRFASRCLQRGSQGTNLKANETHTSYSEVLPSGLEHLDKERRATHYRSSDSITK